MCVTYSPRMSAAIRLSLAAACSATLLLAGGCILDLDGLASGGAAGAGTSGAGTTSASGGAQTASGGAQTASGGAGGSGAAGGTGTTGGSGGASGGSGGASGGSGGAPACALLDCSCIDGATAIAKGAPFADSPRGIALTKDGLYWVNPLSDSVIVALASEGAPKKFTDAGTPRAIEVAGSDAVWTEEQGLFTCTLPSCAKKHQVMGAAAPGSLREVAFDGKTVAWTDNGSGSNSGKVQSCSLGACSPINLMDNMMTTAGLRFYGDSVFWVDQGNGNQNGNVTRSPKTMQDGMQIAAALDLPTGVAVDDAYVYWTEYKANGHVYRCLLSAGYCNKPDDIASSASPFPHPHDIRVAGGRIYWINDDDGSLLSCPQPTCGAEKPKIHVTGRKAVQRFVVGASCLFWTEQGDGGAVMKIAR